MNSKVPTPINMNEVNKTIFSNLIINDFTNFQLGHAEIHKEKSFVILIRFEEGVEEDSNYKISKIGFTLVNAFNNINNKKYVINSVEKTPITDDRYQEGMINLTVKIELSDFAIPDIVYLEDDIIFKSNGEMIDFHIREKDEDVHGNISWKKRNTGGHLCKGKTTKGG